MVRNSAFLALLAAPVIVLACSNSSDGGVASNVAFTPPTNCSVDPSLACSDGSTGILCANGTNPVDEDDTLSCSSPAEAGAATGYCCLSAFSGSDTTCQPDDDIALGCTGGLAGFTCASGDDPTSYDPTLSCSPPTDTGDGASTFCCGYDSDGGTTGDDDDDDDDDDAYAPPTGCSYDTSLVCAGNASGYTCALSNNPEDEDPTLSCSAPTVNVKQATFCCFRGFNEPSASTCAPDDDVSLACAPGTFGFACAPDAGSPESQDSDLTTCILTSDGGDQNDYCCTYAPM